MVYFGDYLSKKKTILVVNSVKRDRWTSNCLNWLPVVTQGKQNTFFYNLYCVFWRLFVKKENDSGGKFSQERPLEIN